MAQFSPNALQNVGMKTALIIISAFFLFAAFKPTSKYDAILWAVDKGNAEKLSGYIDNTIEMILPGSSGNFSKTQAQVVLRRFFNINKVERFTLSREVEQMGSSLLIGTLYTSNGSFPTSLLIRQSGNRNILQSLKIGGD